MAASLTVVSRSRLLGGAGLHGKFFVERPEGFGLLEAGIFGEAAIHEGEFGVGEIDGEGGLEEGAVAFDVGQIDNAKKGFVDVGAVVMVVVFQNVNQLNDCYVSDVVIYRSIDDVTRFLALVWDVPCD